jgi:predicted murein hydrolase (TIGR00659 family)
MLQTIRIKQQANMNEFINSPVFGFTLTVAIMLCYQLLFTKVKTPLLSPFVFSVITIIAFLLITDIPFKSYQKGASIVSYFMGPSVVALAVPLYRQFDKLKAHALPVITGIFVGVFVSVTGGVLLSWLFGLSKEVIISIAPQGTTGAISMNLSQSLGGDPAMSAAFVNIAGNIGYLFGVGVLNRFGVKHPIAVGVALGTASHAIGTNRAFSLGEEHGAMASLSIGVAGIMTSFIMPVLLGVLRFL